MYRCGECSKVYKTRTSLTRHAHNHSKGHQHRCDHCGVLFARRDILNRHVNNGHCSSPNAARHRVHTACEACRGARIKCDGNMPCKLCLEGTKECKYPMRTGRISHSARVVKTSPHRLAHQVDGSPSLENSSHVNSEVSSPGPSEDTPSDHGRSANILTPRSPPPEPFLVDMLRPEDDVGDSGFDSEHISSSSDSLDDTAWPWLHERSFLSQNVVKQAGGGKAGAHQLLRNTSDSVANSPGGSDVDGSVPMAASDRMNDFLSPLTNVIENLVAYAANTAFTPDDRPTRRRYWESISLQLADIFNGFTGEVAADPHRTLYQLVDTYLSNFNPAWPLLTKEQLDAENHHPVLFLVVGSVGAMYGHGLHRQYGTLMHERLRRLLSASLYDLEGPDDGLVWLAHARVLTQVSALFFGQRQGFQYAQHIAAITVAQLRRMNGFREPLLDVYTMSRLSKMTPEAEVAHWKHGETRRRLAYAVLRTDVYTSVLLSTRPLLTADEIRLTFPRADALWLNLEGLHPQAQTIAQRVEESRSLQLPFSDLVRIYLDQTEPNPQLDPVGYELVLFGLQEAVWKFSQDPECFPRLTGHCLEDINIAVAEHRDTIPRPNAERLIPALAVGQIRRRMNELYAERSRLLFALDAWHSAVDASIKAGAFEQHRNTLVSCLLLYHMSRLRLTAPLEWLHHISYRVTEPRSIDWPTHRKVEAWTKSTFAPQAAQQAWDIKWLIERELSMPLRERAQFNFLAFCSLHHAAAVLWTFAGTEDRRSDRQHGPKLTIPLTEIERFLQDCPNYFSQLNLLGGQSFEAAAYRLSKNRFPRDKHSAC